MKTRKDGVNDLLAAVRKRGDKLKIEESVANYLQTNYTTVLPSLPRDIVGCIASFFKKPFVLPAPLRIKLDDVPLKDTPSKLRPTGLR